MPQLSATQRTDRSSRDNMRPPKKTLKFSVNEFRAGVGAEYKLSKKTALEGGKKAGRGPLWSSQLLIKKNDSV